MAIKQLTPEQIQTMSLEEKDTWWLANVYRGDMPQLTARSALTGMLLGGFLSLTNLYIGARTGWTLGVGVTSVIVSFAMFKLISRAGLGRDMTVLENNAMQSIATSAGYINTALFQSFAAYTMITSRIIPMYQAVAWLLVVAVIGVCFAFPMKKRFINEEQLPFPEGKAAGVLMDTLHESDEKEGLFKAKLLAAFGAIAAAIELARDQMVMRVLFAVKSLPDHWDDLLYGDGPVAAWLRERKLTPRLLGTELRELTIQWDSSIILMATGGLMGIRAGVSMLIGGVVNYFVLAPYLIRAGIITPSGGHYGFRQIALWGIWGGVACLTTSSLYSFFAKPTVIINALKGLGRRKEASKADVLGDIELPVKVSLIGAPIAGVVLVVLGYLWFDIKPWLGAIAVPLVFVFSVIAVNATGLTSLTPLSSLGKLTQLTYGALAPGNIVTNIMTASITAEASGNAANLLQDIKPGYMLGAKPRQQAVGHLLGAVAGLSFSVPVWYLVFVQGDVSRYGKDRLPVPGAIIWKTVAQFLMDPAHGMPRSAQAAVVLGALIGIAIEVSKQVTRNRFPLSAVGLGLAFVLRFHDIWAMFLGSLLVWMLEHRTRRWEDRERPAIAPEVPAEKKAAGYREGPAQLPIKKPWYALGAENAEVICAGVIAGGALMGIGVNVLDVLVFPEVKEVHALAPVVKHAVGALEKAH